jgi:hypothetical protein
MFDYILFLLPAIPLAIASYEDFVSKRGEFWDGWIYMAVLLAAFWKLLVYPDTILLSLSFSCLTGAIGLLLLRLKAWGEGDALFWGILGFILPVVDVTYFLISGVVCLLLAGIFDKLILEKWGRRQFHWKKGSSHALWVVLLVYIVYWIVVV